MSKKAKKTSPSVISEADSETVKSLPKKRKTSKSLWGFQIGLLKENCSSSDVPQGRIEILPEVHSSRSAALNAIRKIINNTANSKTIEAEERFAVLQIKEWDLRPSVTQVTKITF